MAKTRRSRRRAQQKKGDSVVDQLLIAAEVNPVGFIDAAKRLGHNVAGGMQDVREAIKRDPEAFQRALQAECLRLAAKFIREERRR